MNKSLSKRQRILFLIAVMLSNVAVMGDNILYPISYNLYAEFPNAVGAVNYILSGPPLLLLITSLVAPFLLRKISKKHLLIIGASLFTAGSVFGVSVLSPAWMVFTRSLVGVGQGFVNVCAVSLLGDVYFDPDINSRYVGFYNASMNVIGFFFSYAAGILAAGSRWQDTFRLYYLSIPMLVLIILFIPNIQSREEEAEETNSSGGGHLGLRFWKIMVFYFLGAMLCMVLAYFMSSYVAENSLGDETLTGTAVAVGQIVSFFGGLAFGFLYSKMKRHTSNLGYLLIMVSMIAWLVMGNTAGVIITYILESLGYIVLMSYGYAHAPQIVPASKASLAVGIATATYALASFAATYFVTFLESVMNTDQVTNLIPVLVVISIIVFVLDVITELPKVKTEEN